MSVTIRQVDVTREELETEVEELRALVGKLNGGAELQNLMRINNEMRAGLIEQCAQVADTQLKAAASMSPNLDMWHSQNDAYQSACRQISKAIRALSLVESLNARKDSE